ncbi:hypothetical protein SSX86_003088 [Deinandra increscens subsp. villosa]|uniref:Homeobox domain-containing protein n=1 Tax=Deinandra increscens subsp. villosa TaxID=3103831 RepID=A0AAP0DGK2_9ASTR
MENQQAAQDQDSGTKTSSSSSSSYLCRQSSTRWTPTSDQIRILKELYYNNGIRSPTADQIQRIAARLRHYGKIEGKNVFYWFQNHKARERQKKRFTPTAPPPPPSAAAAAAVIPSPFSDHHHMHVQSHHLPYFYNHHHQQLLKHHGGGSSSSSSSFVPVGSGYGSVAMEKSFRECSISPGENRFPGGGIHNFRPWVGVDSYSFNKVTPEDETPEDDDGDLSTQIETLPLFPIPGGSSTTGGGGGSHHDFFKMESAVSSEHNSGGGYYTGGNWFHSDGRSSLELSLNSYGYYD